MAAKRSRLSRSSDFQRIYRQGSSTASRFLVLYWFRRPAEPGDEGPRLGLSVSKKLGGAVVRNRIKRLLREAFQASAGQLAEEYDLVVIARPQLIELVTREGEGEKGLVGAAVQRTPGPRRAPHRGAGMSRILGAVNAGAQRGLHRPHPGLPVHPLAHARAALQVLPVVLQLRHRRAARARRPSRASASRRGASCAATRSATAATTPCRRVTTTAGTTTPTRM